MILPRSLVVSLAALVLLPCVEVVQGAWIEARCSACRAVAYELNGRLEAEKPRNAIDMRHRLDKDGTRYGKLIDWQGSELRVIELLDSLCDRMKKYELAAEHPEAHDTQRWALSAGLASSSKSSAQETKQQRKQLENYCHDLLERHEEALSQALRNGEVTAETGSDWLCLTTARQCDKTLEAEEAERAALDVAQGAEAEAAGAVAAPAAPVQLEGTEEL
ncbi:hypothetical protein D9Q98_001440 [Chlorella vulgaris]|uniref:DUF3456 domain-containing protein n=1 Tax=Chlorella vulgaris TaxID=3077 RepID=A0A9D4Z2P5_CHLVU|nr:hypothetical protein D9Q98_001440 [Chlorella vulgaris]